MEPCNYIHSFIGSNMLDMECGLSIQTTIDQHCRRIAKVLSQFCNVPFLPFKIEKLEIIPLRLPTSHPFKAQCSHMVALEERFLKTPLELGPIHFLCKPWGSCADSDVPTGTQTAAAPKLLRVQVGKQLVILTRLDPSCRFL